MRRARRCGPREQRNPAALIEATNTEEAIQRERTTVEQTASAPQPSAPRAEVSPAYEEGAKKVRELATCQLNRLMSCEAKEGEMVSGTLFRKVSIV